MTKVLVATDKPFAAIAVKGIREVVEGAGYELALLEKYTDKAQLLDAVKDANAVIIRSDIIDAPVLDAAKELRLWFVPVPVMTMWIWLLPLPTMCV